MAETNKDSLKEIYHSDSKDNSVSIKTLGDTYVQITVARHLTLSQIIHVLVVLVCNYFLCTNCIHLIFSYTACSLCIFITTVIYCTYKIYTVLFSPRKQSVIFVSHIGLQVTTVNSLRKESSEYISYSDIDNFVIVEMFHRQFSVVTYLSCLLKNKDNHKILFGDFSLKLAQQEIMYQCLKRVIVSTQTRIIEPS